MPATLANSITCPAKMIDSNPQPNRTAGAQRQVVQGLGAGPRRLPRPLAIVLDPDDDPSRKVGASKVISKNATMSVTMGGPYGSTWLLIISV